MANYLYGSSNVYRHFERALGLGLFAGRDLQLIQCTKKAVFDAHLQSVTAAGLVVTAVLPNFVVDICTGVSDEEVQLFARQQVTAHVDSLQLFAERIPSVSVLIVPPLFRSVPPWYGPHLPDLISFLTSEVARVGSNRIGLCAPFVCMPSSLEADGVHLTAAGGERFLRHLDSELGRLLVEVSPLPQVGPDRLDQILAAVTRNTVQLDGFRAIGSTVQLLAQSTSTFEAEVRRRFKDDDLIFARMKEESDAEANRSREDRVVITGLPGAATPSSTHAKKKQHYTEVINNLILIACASSDPQPVLVDVYINLRKDRGQPLVEARLNSVPSAQEFRREGVRLAKAKHASFENLFFSNSVTQATRIRIDILRELSKKLNSATEVAFVQGFISRPVLQYRVKEGSHSLADGVGRSYTFVDAMAKFGHLLARRDLTSVYQKASSTFTGAMSQYFVVLADDNSSPVSQMDSNRTPIGRRGSLAPRRSRGGRPYRGRSQPPFPDRGQKRGLDRVSSEAEGEVADGPSKKQEKEGTSETMDLDETIVNE